MSTIFSENSEKNKDELYCELCDYICCKKQHLTQHFMSKKHKNAKINKINNVENSVNMCICHCGKKYKERTGLWRHKQKCIPIQSNDNIIVEEPIIPDLLDKDLIVILIKQNSEIIKQNAELQGLVLEQNKSITNNQTTNMNNNSHNNSHNKTFNLQFFLNETCKDAMNIMDFVDSVKLQLSDLENIGKVGYVNGISNIIIKNLKTLDVEKRPVHCTDSKRETLYIKDDGKWYNDSIEEKHENKKLRKVIKKIAFKNTKLIPCFREKYPDCNKSISKYSDQYNKLIIEAMGGLGDNDVEKENKIIKNVAKEVVIDKNKYK